MWISTEQGYVTLYIFHKFSSVTKMVKAWWRRTAYLRKYRGVKLTDKGILIVIGIRNRYGFLDDL